MLALMHSSSSSSSQASHAQFASPVLPTMSATSLPILPQRQSALAQRPKLHLDTQQLRTFGKGSSLRLDTLSAVSPTLRNTFSNAYEPPASAAPALGSRPTKPRLSIDSNFSKTSNESSTPSSASTLSSTLTSASNESATISIPYKQPHNLTSILSNSPARPLIPRKMAPVRPLFPAEKRVSFRTPLEEEIKTVKYTLRHSDLESSGSTLSSLSTATSSDSEQTTLSHTLSSTSSSNAPSSPSLQSPSEQSSSAFSSLEGSPRPKGPRIGEKRESSSDEDSDSCPETPVAGRRKRRRDWRWTLGPLPGPSDKSTSSSTSDTTTSEDSS